MKCEHIYGIMYEHELTDLVKLEDLKDCENREKQWIDRELKRFNFCPFCGEKIDWEALKNQ